MATPRKHWFRVADSVAFEPWDNDVAATFLRLGGYLNTRWARDGRTAAEAVVVVLSQATAMQLTGSGSLARARSILRRFATHVTATVDAQGTNTRVCWPKFAEFQKWLSGPGAQPSHDPDPPLPPPQDAPAPAPAPSDARRSDSRSAEAAPPPTEKRAPRKSPGTAAPDRLPEETIQALEQWTRENLPSELTHVRAHIEACLDHFRAKGQPMASWEATCRGWIRRAPEMRRPGTRAPVAPPARKQTQEELQATAKRLRAVEFDRRSHGEI